MNWTKLHTKRLYDRKIETIDGYDMNEIYRRTGNPVSKLTIMAMNGRVVTSDDEDWWDINANYTRRLEVVKNGYHLKGEATATEAGRVFGTIFKIRIPRKQNRKEDTVLHPRGLDFVHPSRTRVRWLVGVTIRMNGGGKLMWMVCRGNWSTSPKGAGLIANTAAMRFSIMWNESNIPRKL